MAVAVVILQPHPVLSQLLPDELVVDEGRAPELRQDQPRHQQQFRLVPQRYPARRKEKKWPSLLSVFESLIMIIRMVYILWQFAVLIQELEDILGRHFEEGDEGVDYPVASHCSSSTLVVLSIAQIDAYLIHVTILHTFISYAIGKKNMMNQLAPLLIFICSLTEGISE
ncbi:unnamed protein product [Miscanthus lutarioriparius]|uniref:Uncharacterized protein n=1 Tax=Miscanthus lutarioriparius TaxID=422564 RepID=A0A811NHV7_9POAL|nr:unnamed protein product [Miscanthus lutarioriparius]